MSKIPSLPAQGNFGPASPGNSGVTMGQWKQHNPFQASGSISGTPQNEAPRPQNPIPGKPLDFPAKSAPATLEVAGRDGAPDREDGRG